MKLGTFNLENMFDRPKAMNLGTWQEGKRILEDYYTLCSLIQEDYYSSNIKDELVTILKRNTGLLSDRESSYILLRDIRGNLFTRKGSNYTITANGRKDWIGWFELKKEAVNEVATKNTARVINEINADVIGLIEVENRTVLRYFNEIVLGFYHQKQYEHIMVIDGNDERGIDVGVMLNNGFYIKEMVSHVDDKDSIGTIFSRDCAEYHVVTPKSNELIVLINHFKSKGYGSASSSDSRRARQAKRVKEIVKQRTEEGNPYIAVIGDLNDIPTNEPLLPLTTGLPQLIDIMSHPNYVSDGRSGTYGNGTQSNKIDYILLSSALATKVISGGIERRGVWGGKNGTLFPHFDTITSKVEAASDHAALWAEIDI